MPDGWTKPTPSGNPRQNHAIAAKLVYPDLTIREVLLLGGFVEEELNAMKDSPHTWQTGENIFDRPSILLWTSFFCGIVRLCLLQGPHNEESRQLQYGATDGGAIADRAFGEYLVRRGQRSIEQVFEDKSHLLPSFLEAVED